MKSVCILVVLLTLSLGCGEKQSDTAAQQAALGLPAPAGPADEALGEIILDFVAINKVLDGVTSEETAKSQAPELQKALDHLAVSLQSAQNVPDDQKAQSRERYQERLDEETLRFSQNIGRILPIPGAAAPIMGVLERMPGLGPAEQTSTGESHEGHNHAPGEGHGSAGQGSGEATDSGSSGTGAPAEAPAGGGH